MEEQDLIKRMYEEIKAPEKAVEQLLEIPDGGSKNRKGVRQKYWKYGAACLLGVLLIPASAFAAQKISSYFQVQVSVEGQKMEAEIHGTNTEPVNDEASEIKEKQEERGKAHYVKVDCDYGEEYTMTKDASDGSCSYSHKDGFSAGKNFWYELICVDNDLDLPSYNNQRVEEMTVNGHRALYYSTNTVAGTKYISKYDTDYNQTLYVFYEEYGYILAFHGMQKLRQEGIVSLAEKATIIEVEKEKQDDYILLSHYLDNPNASQVQIHWQDDKLVTEPVREIGEKLVHGKISMQVKKVDILSSVKGLEMDAFIRKKTVAKLCDAEENIKSYERETLQRGDGVTEPEEKVTGSQIVEPKLVLVTMKVKNTANKQKLFEVPGLQFMEEKEGELYQTHLYNFFNRPAAVETAFMDHMPLYFQETVGGQSFYLKYLEAGEEEEFHFAFLVDEDLLENMYLEIDNNCTIDKERQYIALGR